MLAVCVAAGRSFCWLETAANVVVACFLERDTWLLSDNGKSSRARALCEQVAKKTQSRREQHLLPVCCCTFFLCMRTHLSGASSSRHGPKTLTLKQSAFTGKGPNGQDANNMVDSYNHTDRSSERSPVRNALTSPHLLFDHKSVYCNQQRHCQPIFSHIQGLSWYLFRYCHHFV